MLFKDRRRARHARARRVSSHHVRGPKPLPFPVLRRSVESRSSSLGQSFASTRRIDSASIQRRSRPSLIFELVEITVFTRARSCERALSSHLDPNHFAFVLCRRHRRRSTRARRRDAECGRIARPSPNQPSVGVARNFSAARFCFEDALGFTISNCLPIRRRRRARRARVRSSHRDRRTMSSSGATHRARARLARAISKLSAASSSIASSATTSATTPLFRPATSRGFAARAPIDRAHASASFASSAIDSRERGARNSYRSFAGADVSRRRVALHASALFRSRTSPRL